MINAKKPLTKERKPLRKVKSTRTSENIQEYKVIRGQARRTIKTARRQSWQNFVSSVNSRTSIKRVWNMINKISGKWPPAEVKHLQVSDKEITAVADNADTLVESFSEIVFTQSPCWMSNSKIQLTQYGSIQHSFLYRRSTRCTFQFSRLCCWPGWYSLSDAEASSFGSSQYTPQYP